LFYFPSSFLRSGLRFEILFSPLLYIRSSSACSLSQVHVSFL
jgi:hypothetical protein